MRKIAKDLYPNSKEKYHWSAQDCMTIDKIPYIGKYSDKTPNIYVATGFNKLGMTSSMVCIKNTVEARSHRTGAEGMSRPRDFTIRI